MISRIKLPHEDEFLDAMDNDRDDLYKTTKTPMKPNGCTCSSCPTLSTWSMVLSGIFLYNNL